MTTGTRAPSLGRAASVPVAALLAGAVLGWGCAHTNNDELPTLHMDARPRAAASEKPATCAAEESIKPAKGAVPAGAVPVVEMTVKADRAVPFWMFEQAVRARAAQYCCDGVSVLRAAAEPGDALFHEIEAVGWRRAGPEGE